MFGDLSDMTTHSKARSRFARKLSWLVVASMIAAAMFAPGATVSASDHPIAPNANSVQLVEGNPTCADNQFFSFKIDGTPTNGPTVDDSNGNGAGVIVISNATNTSFDWTLASAYIDDYDMAAVIVKAGDNAFVYFYTDITDDSDTNLQSPDNNGGNQAQISHVEFCFNMKFGTEPTPVVTPAPTPVVTPAPTPVVTPSPTPTGDVGGATGTPTVTSTPTGGVGGATGTPSVTLPPTDTIGSTTGSTGDSWRLILLGMAGLLAVALLLTPTNVAVRATTRRR